MAVHRSRGTYVDGIDGVSFLVDALRRVPQEAKRRVRKAIVAATQDIRADMARRASWSSRIPAAITVRTQFSTATVQLRVNAAKAPHARPYEGIGTGGTVRHPVYGHRDRRWAETPARPFFFPAIDSHKRQVRDAIERAVLESFPR